MRYLLILIIGLSAGYAFGYQDARLHDKTIVERIIDHIQDVNHGRMNADADKALDDLDHH
jgi:hypothetical protein